jgi:hypothetical protein
LEKNLVEDLETVPSWLEQTNLQNQIKNWEAEKSKIINEK